jgi:hypothetical protein
MTRGLETVCSTFKKSPESKSVTAGLGTACPGDGLGSPIIRSYYRFALKGGTNLYGGGIICTWSNWVKELLC